MPNSIAEKRRFFRIDDTISLSYRLIDEQTASAGIKAVNPMLSGRYSMAATLDVLSEQALRIMQKLETQNQDVLELYKVLDAKINLLAQNLMLTRQDDDERISQEVNLSASGIAFHQQESLSIGQYLAIEMYLPSALALILVYGKVVQCESLPSGLYTIGVEYTDIKEQDQELLIKHVVRKQWQQLQEKRAQTESAEQQL